MKRFVKWFCAVMAVICGCQCFGAWSIGEHQLGMNALLMGAIMVQAAWNSHQDEEINHLWRKR